MTLMQSDFFGLGHFLGFGVHSLCECPWAKINFCFQSCLLFFWFSGVISTASEMSSPRSRLLQIGVWKWFHVIPGTREKPQRSLEWAYRFSKAVRFKIAPLYAESKRPLRFVSPVTEIRVIKISFDLAIENDYFNNRVQKSYHTILINSETRAGIIRLHFIQHIRIQFLFWEQYSGKVVSYREIPDLYGLWFKDHV